MNEMKFHAADVVVLIASGHPSIFPADSELSVETTQNLLVIFIHSSVWHQSKWQKMG